MTKNLLTGLMLSMALGGSAAAQEVIFAHGAAPGNPRDVAAQEWAETFAACTEADDTVNVAGAATMGDDVEMLTSASAGIIHVTANSQGAMSQMVPEIGLLGLPFLFPDLPTAWKVAQTHGLARYPTDTMSFIPRPELQTGGSARIG